MKIFNDLQVIVVLVFLQFFPCKSRVLDIFHTPSFDNRRLESHLKMILIRNRHRHNLRHRYQMGWGRLQTEVLK